MKTRVNIRYRTAYIPGKAVPPRQIRIMRREIKTMTNDLLSKQKKLEKSNRFKSDKKMTQKLQDLRKNMPRTNREVQNTWAMLRAYETSKSSSIEGQMTRRKDTINTLQMEGFAITEENFDDFIGFMDNMRDSGFLNYISSDEIVNYYLNIYDNLLKRKDYFNENEVANIAEKATINWLTRTNDVIGNDNLKDVKSYGKMVNKPIGKTYRKHEYI